MAAHLLILYIILPLQASAFHAIPGADMTIYDLYADSKGKDTDKAMEYAEIFLSNLDTPFMDDRLTAISDELSIYYEQEKYLYSKAIHWEEISRMSYEATGNMKKKAESEYRLAKLYFQKGQYHKTLLFATEAQEIFKAEKDTSRLLDCYNMLGAVYYICREFEISNRYFQLFANGARSTRDSTRLISALNNSAQHSRTVRDSAKAISLYDEAIRLCRRINDTSLLCMAYLNLTDAYIEFGKYDLAEKYLKYAEAIARPVDNLGHYYRSLGILKMIQEDPEAAIRNLVKAVETYSAGEFEVKRQFCLDVLHPIYAQLGQYQEAYRTLDAYFNASRENSSKDVYLELFRAQNEIKFNAEKESLKEQRSRQSLLLVSVCSAAIITLLCVSFWIKRKSFKIRQKEIEIRNSILQNEKKENEIRSKNEILEIKKIQQFQMDQLVKEVIGKLQKLERQTPEESMKSTINQICSELRNTKEESEWKEMTQFIPEFNSYFFQNLLKDFPDLSVNERRLCALLNMNMTSKEISEITKQSPHSINIARCRLRNKLNLTGKQESIQEFLSRYNTPDS